MHVIVILYHDQYESSFIDNTFRSLFFFKFVFPIGIKVNAKCNTKHNYLSDVQFIIFFLNFFQGRNNSLTTRS